MQRRARLDSELVRRGLARSREQAAELIAAGLVVVDGTAAMKPATAVRSDAQVRVDDPPRYVSRGALKLGPALAQFEDAGLTVAGKRCLDAGASTGGFTQVLLERGASCVVGVDVGYGQLAWRLRSDPRVIVVDRCNVRHLTLPHIGDVPAELVVADLSFISLTLVLDALVACATPTADFVLLVKPQFEAGRDAVSKGGVVREPEAWAGAVRAVTDAAALRGLGARDVVASTTPGPAGNREFFMWLHQSAPPLDDALLRRAIAAAP